MAEALMLRWHVRVDASVDPVIGVVAPDWYYARALAVMALDIECHRLHVEQAGWTVQRYELIINSR